MVPQVETAPLPLSPPPSEVGLGMLWPTLIVLALLGTTWILVTVWLRAARSAKKRSDERLDLVERLTLSASHSVYVVRAGERRLLLGGAPGGLTLLTELDPPLDESSGHLVHPGAEPSLGMGTPEATPAGGWLEVVRPLINAGAGRPGGAGGAGGPQR